MSASISRETREEASHSSEIPSPSLSMEVPLFKSTAQGASTSVWAATSPLLAGKGGLYLEDCNVSNLADKTKPGFAGVHAHAVNPEEAARLWTVTEEALAPWLAKAS